LAHLRIGIPLLSELDALLGSDEYARHAEFNSRFLSTNGPAMDRYGRLWAKDTLCHWSRRWEYPFAEARVMEHAATVSGPYRILDAGSGVTYFPYLVCHELPRAEFTCFDSNSTYHGMFDQINAAMPGARVRFVEGLLQRMPFPQGSYNAVCCISVLEHTSNYAEILTEFRRVLRPGGLLVLSFDLSLDGRFELPLESARELLAALARDFAPEDGVDLAGELGRLAAEPQAIVSTDHFRCVQPGLLPWKRPLVKALHDLVTGRGWTGGFRSKSIYCLSAVAR
jgi:SAM-dependent methyltransferase